MQERSRAQRQWGRTMEWRSGEEGALHKAGWQEPPRWNAVVQEGVWKGTWTSARRVLTKITLLLSNCPSLLSLYITFGTFHHHS